MHPASLERTSSTGIRTQPRNRYEVFKLVHAKKARKSFTQKHVWGQQQLVSVRLTRIHYTPEQQHRNSEGRERGGLT